MSDNPRDPADVALDKMESAMRAELNGGEDEPSLMGPGGEYNPLERVTTHIDSFEDFDRFKNRYLKLEQENRHLTSKLAHCQGQLDTIQKETAGAFIRIADERSTEREAASYWRAEHAKVVAGVNAAASHLLTVVRDASTTGVDRGD